MDATTDKLISSVLRSHRCPLLSSKVAHVCRRLWKRMSGRPARFKSGLKEQRVRLWRLQGAPRSAQNRSPQTSHMFPSFNRSSFWVALWRLRASTACPVSLMLRPFTFLGVVKVGPLSAPESVRRTCSTPRSRSTSSHFNPSSSLILTPAVTASTYTASKRSPRAAERRALAWQRRGAVSL
jgi:hypothetical protein